MLNRLLVLGLLGFGTLAMTACSGGRVDFVIDNPTGALLEIKLDGQPRSIAPHQEESVTLSAGRHTLESPLTGPVSFIVYANGKGALVNPTFSTYVLVNEVYSTGESGGMNFRPLERTIELDGVSFKGAFEVRDGLFIDQQWDYGVHQDFPEQVLVSNKAKGGIRSKLFEKSAFVHYVESGTPDAGYFEKHRVPGPPPVANYPQKETFPPFKDAEIEAAAAPLREWYASYLRADTASEQRKLQKAYLGLSRPLLDAFAPKSYRLGREENEKYDRLIRRTGDLLGRSAWVERPQ